jgi:hypothetical protein
MDTLIDLLAALIPAAIGVIAILLGSRLSRPEKR